MPRHLLASARPGRPDHDGGCPRTLKEGVAHFDRKEYEKARAAFLQAYALKKHPAVLLNLAQSELRSGHEHDAAKHFTQYLREATDASPTKRDSAQAGLATARAAVIELTVSAGRAGAEKCADGTSEGIAPLTNPIFLAPGSHAIEAKKGEKSVTQNVSGKAGERKEARLTFAAAPPPAQPPPPKGAEGQPKEESTSEAPAEPETPSASSVSPSCVGSRRGQRVSSRPAQPCSLVSARAGFAIGSSVRYNDAERYGRGNQQ